MRLMRASEVPETPRDRLFRASRLHAVVFVLGCVGACAAMIWRHWPAPRAAYYASGVVLLFLLLGRQFVIARFHPSNWLVRVGDEGLFVHFRSYLNEHMSAEDPTVVFFRLETLDRPGWCVKALRLVTSAAKRHRYVELELSVDPTPLAAALDTESGRPAVPEKRWYGTSSTLYQDYPVLIQSRPSSA